MGFASGQLVVISYPFARMAHLQPEHYALLVEPADFSASTQSWIWKVVVGKTFAYHNEIFFSTRKEKP